MSLGDRPLTREFIIRELRTLMIKYPKPSRATSTEMCVWGIDAHTVIKLILDREDSDDL